VKQKTEMEMIGGVLSQASRLKHEAGAGRLRINRGLSLNDSVLNDFAIGYFSK